MYQWQVSYEARARRAAHLPYRFKSVVVSAESPERAKEVAFETLRASGYEVRFPVGEPVRLFRQESRHASV